MARHLAAAPRLPGPQRCASSPASRPAGGGVILSLSQKVPTDGDVVLSHRFRMSFTYTQAAVSEPQAAVRAEAVGCLAAVLDGVRCLPPGDAKLIHECAPGFMV
jgi:hypothetical protein